ncbi:MAG: phosphoribosylformylglycinamidine synthase I [Actinomycetota bacterium]|jgi:phosphoribosylformylglycinamidine synthase subunit PurQ / glutaminase|nr:phosphoribosylformylglycinamidine synthase I [Actinomycetota bacterium]
MSAPHALVLTAPGTNRHPDVMFALQQAGATTSSLNMHQLRQQPRAIDNAHMIVVAGGFSFADALGAGRIFALELSEILGNSLLTAAQAGKPVIGICNGFQTLVRLGVLPGNYRAALGHNDVGGFQCSWISMQPTSKRSVWTRNLSEDIYCPIAHGEGRFTGSDETIKQLHANDQVALTYSGRNPNGSRDDIAGICDETGFVLGLMPHPENHVVARQHPQYHRGRTDGLGLRLFEQGVAVARS